MDDVDPQLVAEIKRDEGCRLAAYPDPLSPRGKAMARLKVGNPQDARVAGLSGAPWTIGYGHTGPEVHEGLVWTQAEADAALIADLRLHNALLARVLPWTSQLSAPRRRVFQNMIFNMGWDNPRTPQREGLSGFVNSLAAAARGGWHECAAGLEASLWARQTGDRARRLIAQVRTGVEAA